MLANCNKHLRAHGKEVPPQCVECKNGPNEWHPCKYPDGMMKTGPTEIAQDPFAQPLTGCSVKVMRSFDYCHFEVNLSANCVIDAEVDDLRKRAARLADKAVEQYQKAKSVRARVNSVADRLKWDAEEFARIDALAETDRSEEEKAVWKAYKDALYITSHPYNYEDDWQDDPDQH